MKRFLSRAAVSAVRFAWRVPILRHALASFDSARTWFTDRSWIFQALQDSWIEIDTQTRQELQRVHEYLLANAAIVQKIRRVNLQFTVGPSGLIVTPNASRMDGDPNNSPEEKTIVENWNHSRAESWARWWHKPEWNSEITGAQLTRVWAGLLFDKGEIFVVLTEEQMPGVNGQLIPRTQTIDAHRCQTPPRREYQGRAIIDGKEVDANGKVIAYWFKKAHYENYLTGNALPADIFDRIPAYDKNGRKQVIHKFKTLRPGQLRGLPEGFSVYNLVRDNLDLHKLEMQAAKLASSIANVETNPGGELDALLNRRARVGYGTSSQTGAPIQQTAWADYKVTLGGTNVALKSGDKLENFMINRPTVATQDYWDLHYTLICMGYNVPKLLIMPYSLQGTVTRADLDIAGYGFGRENFEIIAELLREVYEWQTEWAVKYDRSLDGQEPDDYLACVIRPPRAPNVDIGYTAKALETELKLGVKTIQDVYAERQQNWRDQLRQIAEARKYMGELATEYGIPVETISTLAINESTPSGDQNGESAEQIAKKKEEEITA